MSLNYVMIGANDPVLARGFYDAILPLTGAKIVMDFMPHGFCYEFRNGSRIFVSKPFNEAVATAGNGSMTGILCADRAEVRALHQAALAHGGSNEGDPGPRPNYGPEFYGAYVRDLEGNKLSFVWFGAQD